MQVTFIGHASILARSKSISLLSDPWWRGPCFGAQWWNRPEPRSDLVYEDPPDFVYVSHGHEDHLHPGTLNTLPRSCRMLVSSVLDLASPLRNLGFEVIEVAPDSPVALGSGIEVWIWPTHGDDTLLVLKDGSETLINLNDALHSAPRNVQEEHIALLRQRAPDPDYVFCGYGIASHFPNCYQIPGKNDQLTAARRQAHFNAQWAYLMHELSPKFGFPFAANVVLFEEDLINLNEAVHNTERPPDRYHQLYGRPPGHLIDMAPGFKIDAGRVVHDCQFQQIEIEQLRSDNSEAYRRANTYSAPTDEQVQQIVSLLDDNADRCRKYLLEFTGDYTFLIEFRGSTKGIVITKRDARIDISVLLEDDNQVPSPDVTLRTRAVYLRRSLEVPHADEVLFVGSGAVIEFREREAAEINLHRELMTLVRRHEAPPASRFGDNPEWVFRMKRRVKQLLGRGEEDLYDLSRWIVYE